MFAKQEALHFSGFGSIRSSLKNGLRRRSGLIANPETIHMSEKSIPYFCRWRRNGDLAGGVKA